MDERKFVKVSPFMMDDILPAARVTSIDFSAVSCVLHVFCFCVVDFVVTLYHALRPLATAVESGTSRQTL